ncbi:MAG: acyl-CoA dehydrogenase family protein [Solirubrobacteraceae bacterium]
MNAMEKLLFTEEHQIFRDTMKSFLKTEVEPFNKKWEAERKVDRALFKKAGDLGIFGLHAPVEYGGSGLDYSYAMVQSEELGYSGFSGVATALGAHQYLAMTYLLNSEEDYIIEKYIKPSIAGTFVGCLGMTEPNAGSDLMAIKTVAVKDGDHYVINGSKTFISNGFYGDYMVTAVKTNPEAGAGGVSMILIDLNTPGVTKSKLEKLGIHSSDTAEIGLSDVRVPVANLIGSEGLGFYYMMKNLVIERMTIVWGCITGAERLLEDTLAYMKDRKAFGKPIDKFQALRHRIVDIATEIESCKAFTYLTTYRHIQGENVVKECAMLKLQAADLLNKVAYECLQFHGGYGFIEEYPIARAYRDARIQNIYGGSSEIMKEIISKMVIDGVTYG